MNCTTCGAEVQAAATFCRQCGAPIRPGAAVAVAVEESPIRFTLEAGALEIFGRALLAAFCSIFVVPIPWILPWFYRWLLGGLRGDDGESFRFSGAASNVWRVLLTLVLLFGASITLAIVRGDDGSAKWLWGDLLIQILSLYFSWTIVKWIIDHLELGGRRWRFDGSLLGFVGWNLLLYLSIFTIIGWAWALVGLYNWIADNVQDAGGKLRFLGTPDTRCSGGPSL